MKNLKKVILGLFLLGLMFLIKGGEATAAPKAVTNLRQTDHSSNNIYAAWDYQGGIDMSFEVWISTAKNGGYVKKRTVYKNSVFITGLSNNSFYYVKVRPVQGSSDYGKYSEPVMMATGPEEGVREIKQTDAATKSISLSWQASQGVSGYRVRYREIDASNNSTKYMDITATSVKITGLKKNTKYYVWVSPFLKTNGYVAEYHKNAYIYNSECMSVLPTKMSKLKVEHYFENIGVVYFQINENNAADKYQVQIRDGSKVLANVKSNSSYLVRVKSNALKKYKFYKAPVRALIETGNGYKYGKWSDYIYLGRSPYVKLDKTDSKKGIKASWKRMKGATNYTVYISSKENSGYKKAATTKKTNYTIKKYGKAKLKRGKKYYVYVVANKKEGGKTYKVKSWKRYLYL